MIYKPRVANKVAVPFGGVSLSQGKFSSYRHTTQCNYTQSPLGIKLNVIDVTGNSSKIYAKFPHFPKFLTTNAREKK